MANFLINRKNNCGYYRSATITNKFIWKEEIRKRRKKISKGDECWRDVDRSSERQVVLSGKKERKKYWG